MSTEETSSASQAWLHALAVVVPVLLITASMFLILSRINTEHALTQREVQGLAQVRRLNDVTLALQRIRGLNQILLKDGDRSIKSELDRAAGTLDDLFVGVGRDFAHDPFGLAPALAALRDDTRNMVADQDSAMTREELFETHTRLVDRTRGIIHLVAFRSDMLQDPHMKSHLLTDLIVSRLPNLIESIGKVRGDGSGLLATEHSGDLDRFRFGAKLGAMHQSWREVIRNQDNLLESAPEMKPLFTCFSKGAEQPASRFFHLGDAVLNQTAFGVDARLFFQKGSDAIAVISGCHDILLDTLAEMLKERVLDLENERMTIVSGLLLAMFFMLAILFNLYQRNRRFLKNLTNSEAKNRAIFASAVDGILTIDEQGTILLANDALENIFGYAPGELIGRNVSVLMPSPHREEHDGHLERYRQTGIKKIIGSIREVEGICKDGGRFPLELSVSAFEMEGKSYFTGILHDITERKIAKEALHSAYNELERRVQERTRELQNVNEQLVDEIRERNQAESGLRLAAKVFETASEAIVITDVSGTIIDVNQAFTNITLFTREEAIGSNPSIGKSGRHDDAFYQEMWHTITTTGSWYGEIWDRRKNGEIYPKWLTINAVKDTSGAVSHFVGIFTDISHLKATEERLEQLAFYDPLTSLPNRMLFKDRLTQEFEAARRHDKRVAAFFIDLDRFKHVNDTLGHAAGDQLLIEIANRIRSCVRTSDTVARLGGDEFTVILPDIDTGQDAAPIARKIIQSLQQPVLLGNNRAHVGASIGISIFPEDGEDFDAITKYADVAMYHAKESVRGNFKFFRADMNTKSTDRVLMETEMRAALESGQFIVHYQPKVTIKTGRIEGMEALVRWRKPDGTIIPPGRFIPLAEETGLIVAIGEQVLRMACRQNKAWIDRGMKPLRVAVNLSPRQFQQRNLAQTVEDILIETGMPAQHLDLEVTESMMMLDGKKAINTLNRLREIGLSISMDDFGTGYSSLSYLKRFPIQTLKVDQSFVRDLTVDSDDAAIVSAIVSMAKSLKLHVVAEGVETADQLRFLRKIGCHEIQGYHISPPIPPESFERFVKDDPCLLDDRK